jgi:hypothetical protein
MSSDVQRSLTTGRKKRATASETSLSIIFLMSSPLKIEGGSVS